MFGLGKRGVYGSGFFEDMVFDAGVYSAPRSDKLEVVFMGIACALCSALYLYCMWRSDLV